MKKMIRASLYIFMVLQFFVYSLSLYSMQRAGLLRGRGLTRSYANCNRGRLNSNGNNLFLQTGSLQYLACSNPYIAYRNFSNTKFSNDGGAAANYESKLKGVFTNQKEPAELVPQENEDTSLIEDLAFEVIKVIKTIEKDELTNNNIAIIRQKIEDLCLGSKIKELAINSDQASNLMIKAIAKRFNIDDIEAAAILDTPGARYFTGKYLRDNKEFCMFTATKIFLEAFQQIVKGFEIEVGIPLMLSNEYAIGLNFVKGLFLEIDVYPKALHTPWGTFELFSAIDGKQQILARLNELLINITEATLEFKIGESSFYGIHRCKDFSLPEPKLLSFKMSRRSVRATNFVWSVLRELDSKLYKGSFSNAKYNEDFDFSYKKYIPRCFTEQEIYGQIINFFEENESYLKILSEELEKTSQNLDAKLNALFNLVNNAFEKTQLNRKDIQSLDSPLIFSLIEFIAHKVNSKNTLLHFVLLKERTLELDNVACVLLLAGADPKGDISSMSYVAKILKWLTSEEIDRIREKWDSDILLLADESAKDSCIKRMFKLIVNNEGERKSNSNPLAHWLYAKQNNYDLFFKVFEMITPKESIKNASESGWF